MRALDCGCIVGEKGMAYLCRDHQYLEEWRRDDMRFYAELAAVAVFLCGLFGWFIYAIAILF